ncbi:MAG: glycosyl hydrolase, partial [Planctomycetes bacterium]|nr:glycosyl hydrolase [Planctomycetota bacterium]
MLSLSLLIWSVVWAPQVEDVAAPPEISRFKALEYRSIGPHRGGRSAAVAGIPGDATTYYMGAAGGGVWRTEDAGQTWSNLSDGYFGGSIGAVAVSQWDSNVIYVGGGEKTVRGNVSHGSGMWKST